MVDIIAAATGGTSGSIPIVTAIGGVAVSLTTVYFNNKRQATETKVNADHITALTSQITSLGAQVLELKAENAKLLVEIKLLREQMGPVSIPKKKKKR